jgi:hypothetical protein
MSRRDKRQLVVIYILLIIAMVFAGMVWSGAFGSPKYTRDAPLLSQSEHGTGLLVTPTDTSYAGFEAMQEDKATFLQNTTNPQKSE